MSSGPRLTRRSVIWGYRTPDGVFKESGALPWREVGTYIALALLSGNAVFIWDEGYNEWRQVGD